MSAGCECPRPGSVAWIRDAFADCVYSPVDVAGFALGLASIACWLVAQLPQFIQNFRLKSAESLSPWFLAEWLLGDTFNLLGCLMTGDQLATETYTAVYFMCVDVAMIFQFVYYTLRARDAWELVSADLRDPEYARLEGSADDEDDDEDEDEDEDEGRGEGEGLEGEGREGEGANAASGRRRRGGGARRGSGGAFARAAPLAAVATGSVAVAVAVAVCVLVPGHGFGHGLRFEGGEDDPNASSAGVRPRGDDLFFFEGDSAAGGGGGGGGGAVRYCGETFNPPWEKVLGRSIGYVSSAFYLGSRISQIVKNRARRSCEGLSVAMFAVAAAANSFYGASIVLRATSWRLALDSAPWLLGSLGTVALDATILAQSVKYEREAETREEEEEGGRRARGGEGGFFDPGGDEANDAAPLLAAGDDAVLREA